MTARKFIITIFIFYFISIFKANGINYYVNPSSNEIIENGSIEFPWKSINQVNLNTSLFVPGDTIYFKRGQVFSGTLFCTKSGIKNMPIVYTAYGIGEMPTLTNSSSDVIKVVNQQFVVIDNFKIIDFKMDVLDHAKTAIISYAIILNNAPNCTIQHCDISLVGVGIQLLSGSNYTTIANNNIHNLRIVRSTPGGDDDYGANAMVIGTSNNIIKNNIFEECWAYCYDYGHDGGAIEFFGQNMNDNLVMYNVAIECDGFLEVGSNSGGNSINNTIAYNKIIDCGLLGVFHNNSKFTVNIFNTSYINNDIIETKFLFTNTINLFWLGDYSKNGVVNLKNNIFWVVSGINVVPANVNSIFLTHDHNIYRFKNGNLGMILDSTEYMLNDSISGKLFLDTVGLPKYWNVHLKFNSPAIDFGIQAGFLNDFDGNLIVNEPDAGIYEFQVDSTTMLQVTIEADSILCNGGFTILHVKAMFGTPPYSGVGNFEVKAGKYTFEVTDALGKVGFATVYIGEPSKLSIATFQKVDFTLSGLTDLVVTASGGMPPYSYKLDTGLFQYANIFHELQGGDYILSVKDSNNCIDSLVVHIVDVNTTEISNSKLLIRVSPNPTTSYFTLSPIKYKNYVYTMSVKVYSLSSGILMFSTQTLSNASVKFGSTFFPGYYILVVEVAGTTQAVQLIKL